MLLVCSIASVYSAITVTPSTLGNLFLSTDAVSIPVTATVGNRVDWSVSDYFGNAVSSGSVVPVATKATIAPPGNTPGWYALTLKEYSGVNLSSMLLSSYAIVTPFATSASSRFGVMTHFAQFDDQSVMPLITRAGISHIRDEQYWNHIENPKLTYTYPAKFLSYMSAAAANGITPLIPLTWSNRFYDYEAGDFTAPHTENGLVGYAAYARDLIRQYPQIKTLEVWNEYNAGTFIKGPATANKPLYYTLMLQQVYDLVAPIYTVKVLGGGTVPIAHGFFRDILARGAHLFCNGFSIHPYRTYPDGVDLEISELYNLIRAVTVDGTAKAVWATEFGMSAASEADRFPAASYLAQIATLMLTQKIERMYYYLLMDNGSFPFRGLVGNPVDPRGKFRPHPSLIAYANISRQLSGAVYKGRFAKAPPSTYAFYFQRGVDQVAVLWSNFPAVVELITASNVTVIDMMGGSTVLSPVDGKVALHVTKDVQYVVGPVTSVSQPVKNVLADSLSGYSKTPEKNGWYYGYALPAAVYDPAAFQPMSWLIWGSDNFRWIQPGVSYPFGDGASLHPSGNVAIRRWVSNYAGNASLSGKLSRGAGGDGTGVRIFVDGVEVYSTILTPSQSITYNVPVTLAVGSKVDFTVNQVANQSYDVTGFTAQIIR